MFHYNLVCDIEIGGETYECHGSLYSPCQFRIGDKLTVPWDEATVEDVAWDIEVPGEAYLGLETVSLSNEHDWSTCGICPGMFNYSLPDLPWVTRQGRKEGGMSEPKCETCRFWYRYDAEEGICRRYPPSTYLVEMEAFTFPDISTGDWCGEYQPKPNLE